MLLPYSRPRNFHLFWGPSLPSLSTCWQVIFCLIHLSVGRAKKRRYPSFFSNKRSWLDCCWGRVWSSLPQIHPSSWFCFPNFPPGSTLDPTRRSLQGTHKGPVQMIPLQTWIKRWLPIAQSVIKNLETCCVCIYLPPEISSSNHVFVETMIWHFPKLRTSCQSTLLPAKLGVLYGSGKCNLLLDPSNTTPSRRDPSQLTFSMMDRFPTSIAWNGKSVKLNCQTSPTSRYAGTSCLSWVPQPSEWHSVHERHMRSLSVSIDPK